MAVFDFIEQNGVGAGFVYKNTAQGYYFDGSSFNQITDDDYPGMIPVTSITRSGTTATVTSTTTHGLVTGDTVIMSGATETDYNIEATVTVTSTTTFTYEVANSPTTPATGSPIGNQVGSSVRGIVYLDGTYYVMTPSGAIQGSELEDPTDWSALNVIQSRMEPDAGVCLARQLNLIVAFSEYSTEFFYNAGNPTGSPLLPFPSAFFEVGCAVAESVATIENVIYFMGVSKAKGRSVYQLDGTTPNMVSNPAIDRILNSSNLSDVSSYAIKMSGHGLYILTLRDIGITLVYDYTTDQWGQWTELTLGSTQAITAATWSLGLATATVTGHGLVDGAYCTIASSDPSAYDGDYVINVIDDDTFTFEIASDPGTYVGSATVATYTESYFNMGSYTSGGGFDLVQDSTTGFIYALDTGVYLDDTSPIRFSIRTPKFDGGDNTNKLFSRAEIIGDKVTGTSYLRYSNDDYQTWSNYRPLDMSLNRTKLDRLGRGRRRAFEMINYDNQPIRVEALEVTINGGTS